MAKKKKKKEEAPLPLQITNRAGMALRLIPPSVTMQPATMP